MIELRKTTVIAIPDAKIVGLEVINGGGQNPVPSLWAKIFREKLLEELAGEQAILDMYVGWMGEYDQQNDTFRYIAGRLMPIEYSVPDGFDHRSVSSCQAGLSRINGSFKDGEIFKQAHALTVQGICEMGYTPDYSYGWSAEAYPLELSFDAESGTIHYICPCNEK